MKKYFCVILLLILSIYTSAQKCDFIVNGVDEFTGKKSLLTKPFNINKSFTSRYFFSFSISSIDKQRFIFIQLTGGGQSLFIKKENPLMIKLKDDKIINLSPFETTPTKYESIANGVTVSRITPKYEISDDDLNRISTIGISKIRMVTDDGVYDSDVKDKDNKNIANAIYCTISNDPK